MNYDVPLNYYFM